MNNNPELDFKDMVFLFEEQVSKEATNKKLADRCTNSYEELKISHGVPYATRILSIICGYYWVEQFLRTYREKGGILDWEDYYKYAVK